MDGHPPDGLSKTPLWGEASARREEGGKVISNHGDLH